MKFLKGGNLAKLVAFFLIAAVLTCTVAFASGGWQSFTEGDPDSDNTAGNITGPDGDVDENTDGNNGVVQPPTVEPTPIFTHYLTGLTVTAEEAATIPLAFVYSTADPLYGISTAFLTVEIPTEDDNTRLIALTSPSKYLGKLGSISPTRDYICSLAYGLGATLIHRGNDDSFVYGTGEHKTLDLTAHGGYSYTEYSEYHYSNSDLVAALLKNTGTATAKPAGLSAPFSFTDSTVKGSKTATTVIIPYSESNTTQLIYDAESGEYVLHKTGGAVKDLLNDSTCIYTNAFVLYADCTTYETAEATETVFDTVSGGSGYYFTMGSAMHISWTCDDRGSLIFLDEDGNRLTVNRGSSYIAFEKASRINDTTYS